MRRIYQVTITATVTAVFIEESSNSEFIHGYQFVVDTKGISQVTRACHSVGSPNIMLLHTHGQWQEALRG